ncbi:MAG TPA: hypothetical protein ENK35_07005 [Candidatus Tenderia sp.]|nr:hypothetical protein [Candidatus Tenderia sp.]
MKAHLKPQIRYIGVANFGNSPAITRNLRLDVTNLGFNLLHPELIEVPKKFYSAHPDGGLTIY